MVQNAFDEMLKRLVGSSLRWRPTKKESLGSEIEGGIDCQYCCASFANEAPLGCLQYMMSHDFCGRFLMVHGRRFLHISTFKTNNGMAEWGLL